jgi:hypothetical protein
VTPAEQLAHWRAITDDATEGPWPIDHMNVIGNAAGSWGPLRYEARRVDHDADFIAEARTAMPALLAFAEAVLALADRQEYGSLRWEQPLPVPEHVGDIRRIAIEHLGGGS